VPSSSRRREALGYCGLGQLAPGWMTAPTRNDGAAVGAGAVAAALLEIAAAGVVMLLGSGVVTGKAGGATVWGGGGVRGGGVGGDGGCGKGGGVSLSSMATTLCCVSCTTLRAKPD